MPVAAAAALAAGGVVFATAASAAAPTAPHLTLNAPTQLINNGTSVSKGVQIRVNNTQSGFGAITAGTLSVTISGITALPCSDITLTPENTGPSSAGTFTSPALSSPGGIAPCTFTATGFSQPANSDVTYNYDVSVNAPAVVGTLSGSATFSEPDAGPPVTTVTSTSNTTSTSLVNPPTVNPAAPAFTTTPVRTPIVNQPYSFTEVTNLGTPTAEFYAFGTHLRSDGTYSSTTRGASDTLSNGHAAIDLSPRFAFDVVTGKIVNTSALDVTNSSRYFTWTIVANNGVGGSTVVVPAIGSGSTTVPTPGVALHDVDSAPFTLPVLFSDVALNHVLAKEIYDLADNGDITGFADGTFRPTTLVNREQFVAILENERGACSTGDPSPFSDVPNSSIFCEPIRDAQADGIVNGFTDGTFRPTAPVLRQAIAAYLYRANAVWNLSISDPGDALCTQPIPFSDVSASSLFCGDIEWAAANHIANGYANGTFHPTATATRQEAAAFIDRFDNLP